MQKYKEIKYTTNKMVSYCDICKKETESYYNCYLCGKMICQDCLKKGNDNNIGGIDWQRICKECLEEYGDEFKILFKAAKDAKEKEESYRSRHNIYSPNYKKTNKMKKKVKLCKEFTGL